MFMDVLYTVSRILSSDINADEHGDSWKAMIHGCSANHQLGKNKTNTNGIGWDLNLQI